MNRVTPGCVALVAARVGKVRLIDNLIFGPPGASPQMLLQLALTAQRAVDAGALIPGFIFFIVDKSKGWNPYDWWFMAAFGCAILGGLIGLVLFGYLSKKRKSQKD